MAPEDPEIVPILRPRLPDADALAPWLRAIDASRVYSNFGPLTRNLERRIAAHTRAAGAATVCNGTVALSLALQAAGVTPGDAFLCLMPAWTFVATPASAVQLGMIPYFVDVDPATWVLEPDQTLVDVLRAPKPVGAIIVVAPFGTPVDPAVWDNIAEHTGRPVIVDAAAGFDSARAGRSAMMISLHATKALGVGEGGVIVSTDAALVERVKSLSVFGFSEEREALLRGTNAKISEYTAAVGLAGLDRWEATRAELKSLKDEMIRRVKEIPGVGFAPGLEEDYQSTTFNVVLPERNALAVKAALRERGIDSRLWWGRGCHRHKAYAAYPRTPLPVTEELADRVLGLPFFLGMTEAEIDRVVRGLAGVL